MLGNANNFNFAVMPHEHLLQLAIISLCSDNYCWQHFFAFPVHMLRGCALIVDGSGVLALHTTAHVSQYAAHGLRSVMASCKIQ